MTRFSVSLLRPIRFLVVVVACALLLFSNAFPAVAAGVGSRSNPSEGETQLNKILDKSEEAAQSGLSSRKEVEKRSNRGINEVQADADKNQMKRPENSQGAISFTDKVKQVFEKAAPKS